MRAPRKYDRPCGVYPSRPCRYIVAALCPACRSCATIGSSTPRVVHRSGGSLDIDGRWYPSWNCWRCCNVEQRHHDLRIDGPSTQMPGKHEAARVHWGTVALTLTLRRYRESARET